MIGNADGESMGGGIAWNTVDTLEVFLLAIFGDAFRPFFLGPNIQGIAVFHVVHKRYGETTRIGDTRGFDADNRTRPGVVGEQCTQLRKVGMLRQDGFAAAVDTHDFWRTLEGTKHDNDTFVFLYVGDRFDAATGEVEVSDLVFVEDAEGVAAFGRAIHVSVTVEGRGGYKENVLLGDPFAERWNDGLESFSHNGKYGPLGASARLRQGGV